MNNFVIIIWLLVVRVNDLTIQCDDDNDNDIDDNNDNNNDDDDDYDMSYSFKSKMKEAKTLDIVYLSSHIC